jgi:hypothetical protein
MAAPLTEERVFSGSSFLTGFARLFFRVPGPVKILFEGNGKRKQTTSWGSES